MKRAMGPGLGPGRPRGQYTQGQRLVRLLETLRTERHQHSMEDLAERAGVTPRSLRRDLAALRDCGYGVVLDGGAVSLPEVPRA